MEEMHRVTMTLGIVPGPYFKELIVCQYKNLVRPTHGILLGQDPFDYHFPVLMAQMSLIFLTARFIYFLLRPFRQSIITAQILAGIFLGPSFLWYYIPAIMKLFPPGGRMILSVTAYLGVILHIFILGLRMDANLIRQSGACEVLIGLCAFAVPAIIGFLAFKTIVDIKDADEPVIKSIPSIVLINSMSAFPVITSVLSDLKILNSDLGRLAAKACMINDMSCFFMGQILFTGRFALGEGSYETALQYVICFSFFVLTIVCILRPFIVRLTKYTRPGEAMEEFHFFCIMLVVFLCAFGSELVGQACFFGPFLFGLALPDGKPLSAGLEQRLQTISGGLLVPLFCAFGGLRMNLFAKGNGNSHDVVKLILAVTYTSKFIGVICPAVLCGVTYLDAFCLSLIMCCKGIIEIAIYVQWMDSKVVDVHSFNTLLTSLLIVTGFARPLVSCLYDPTKRYRTNSRRTIQGANYNMQMRVLVCIHNEDNVPMTIHLLKSCNPSRVSPVTVFVLHLMKLTASSAAILVPHYQGDTLKSDGNCSMHIFNAFERLEQQYKGTIAVQQFTAVAPYKSMHSDICTVAADKRTTIVIIPFHKQWSIDGKVGFVNRSIRIVNKNVMDWAPCSVGLLINRCQMDSNQSILSCDLSYSIALLFFGGDDDYEALAICGRMAGNPNVSLTVVLFKHDLCNYEVKKLECLIHHYAARDCRGRIHFKEFMVQNGEEITKVVRSLGDAFDLVIVGRHFDPRSPIASGLTEWSEVPELGLIGDMLSSADFKFAVLVIVQQPLMTGLTELRSMNSSRSISSKVSSIFSSDEDRHTLVEK